MQFSYNDMSQATEITYQGLGGKAVLFLLDGERISGEGGANNIDYGRFNVNDIDRIEIVRGGCCHLYTTAEPLEVLSTSLHAKVSVPLPLAFPPDMQGKTARCTRFRQVSTVRTFSTLTSFGYRKRESYTIADSIGKVRETRLSNGGG